MSAMITPQRAKGGRGPRDRDGRGALPSKNPIRADTPPTFSRSLSADLLQDEGTGPPAAAHSRRPPPVVVSKGRAGPRQMIAQRGGKQVRTTPELVSGFPSRYGTPPTDLPTARAPLLPVDGSRP